MLTFFFVRNYFSLKYQPRVVAKGSGGWQNFGMGGSAELVRLWKRSGGTRKADKHCTLDAECIITFCWIINSRSNVVLRVTDTSCYFNFTQAVANYNTDVNSDTQIVSHLFLFWNSCLEATVYCLLHTENTPFCFLSVGSEHKNWLKNGKIVIILFASVGRNWSVRSKTFRPPGSSLRTCTGESCYLSGGVEGWKFSLVEVAVAFIKIKTYKGRKDWKWWQSVGNKVGLMSEKVWRI